MDSKQGLTIEQANADINAGIQALVLRALQNDLAAARVRIAELEAQAASVAKPDADPAAN